MIVINEFLPNPDGSDANEWLELLNTGDRAANLSGWHLQTANGKKTILSGTVQSKEYKVFYKKDYKFTLRNTDESIALYDASGNLVDKAGFSGQALSGKSYSRQAPLEAMSPLTGQESGGFVATVPTPGAANIQTSALALINNSFALDQPLSSAAFSTAQVVLLCIGVGVFLSAVSLYCIKHEDLSDLFFARDEEAGS